MLAYYLKQAKPSSKILIVDSRSEIDEYPQLRQAWNDLYPGMIQWVAGDGPLQRVDVKGKAVYSASGERYTGEVINVIPPQRAGAIARSADLADAGGWCPVDPRSFESTRHAGIYVIGDACRAGDMPKAASSANTQAKICAAAIAARSAGESLPEPFLISVFYGLLGRRSAISNIGIYRVVDGRIRRTAGGITPVEASGKTRRKEMKYATGWFRSITEQAFG